MQEILRKEMDSFVDSQKNIQKVIIVQSLARGAFARKKVKHLSKSLLSYIWVLTWISGTYLQTPHKERNSLFRELIKNERMYISRLSLMVKGYMQPLVKSSNTKLLSFSHILQPDDISAIFSNTEVCVR